LPANLNQKALMQDLLDQGIATRRGIMCSHREAPYSGGQQRHDLHQSELAQDHSILLPIYAQMSEDDVDRVTDALKKHFAIDQNRPSCFSRKSLIGLRTPTR
jgi:dTDP-4-amino-4,6-dideoxygalactose transaminase